MRSAGEHSSRRQITRHLEAKRVSTFGALLMRRRHFYAAINFSLSLSVVPLCDSSPIKRFAVENCTKQPFFVVVSLHEAFFKIER